MKTIRVFKDEFGNQARIEGWLGFDRFTLRLLPVTVRYDFEYTYDSAGAALRALSSLHLIFPFVGTRFEEVH